MDGQRAWRCGCDERRRGRKGRRRAAASGVEDERVGEGQPRSGVEDERVGEGQPRSGVEDGAAKAAAQRRRAKVDGQAPSSLYLGVRSSGLDATLGPSRIGGSFAVARPDDPDEQRVGAYVDLRDMDAVVAKRYVPIKLPEGVLRFFDQGIVAGHLDRLILAYHGHTRADEALPMRRLDMRTTMHGGVVRYHADWPVASQLVGEVNVTFDHTRGRISSGVMQGLALDAGRSST